MQLLAIVVAVPTFEHPVLNANAQEPEGEAPKEEPESGKPPASA